jgi:transcriptional regulator GlxA family with amidase domain
VTQRKVAIVIFDDMEVLDFAGPFEVFSVAGRNEQVKPFDVKLVAQDPGLIRARNEFCVMPHSTFEDCPQQDILIVPGGGGHRADGTPFGTRKEMNNPAMLEFIQHLNISTELTLSVCTGALVLARAGLLEGLRATTHHGAFDQLRAVAPNTTVLEGVKMVDAGRIVTSGGISAGIDMSLGVVARLLGRDVALETAQYMEYDWTEVKA